MKKVPNNCCLESSDIRNSNNNISTNPIQMHAFVEKTYLNPTYCKLCGGLLVGLVLFRQGLQCQYCKFDCHKNCLKFVPSKCPLVSPTATSSSSNISSFSNTFTQPTKTDCCQVN